MDSAIEYASIIRLSAFVCFFIAFALLESTFQNRKRIYQRSSRWPANLSLVVLNSLAIKLLLPFSAIYLAIWAEKHNIGLLNHLSISFTLKCVFACILLDLTIWYQHLLMHRFSILWRLHQVHHMDLELDVSSGLRFHPIEIILSMLIKFSIILIIGAPVLAVIIFEILLNSFAMFNHSNLALPQKIDKLLRTLIVTPNMHLIHHSTNTVEANSNYGFNLSIWDRIFGTYTKAPSVDQSIMPLGIGAYRQESQCFNLKILLLAPFIQLNSQERQIKD